MRHFTSILRFVICGLSFLFAAHAAPVDPIPSEPVRIGNETQFLFDNWIVDNRWTDQWQRTGVNVVFHPPVKHVGNPILPGEGGYVTALYDKEDKIYKMWYSKWYIKNPSAPGRGDDKLSHALCYAESKDGLNWVLPKLGLIEFDGTKENNAVWQGPNGYRADAPQILQLSPTEDRHGFKYLMLYRTTGAGKELNGTAVVGSQDGIHWDPQSNRRLIGIGSDTYNTIVYDPRREEYVCYMRPKHIYEKETGQGRLYDGAARRIARLSSKTFWPEWIGDPQTILVPDIEDDKKGMRFFYGMPTRYESGIYWSFLWLYNEKNLYPELAWSRDGFEFQRVSGRPPLIPLGEPGSWDGGMIFAAPFWVEVGNEWWFYYTGWDGFHNTLDRKRGIGIAKVRKEGLLSVKGPKDPGAIATRRLIWPGGNLSINADPAGGEIKVRVVDAKRKPLENFTWDLCDPIENNTAQTVTWKGRSLDELKGQEIRLEFMLRIGDLYTFKAEPIIPQP